MNPSGKKIRKAVISAAGFGTRFLPTVKAYPKELIPVLDKPNLQWLVEELIAAGLDQIMIVHRPDSAEQQKYFTPDKNLEKYLKSMGKEAYLNSLKTIWKKAKLFFLPQDPKLPYGNACPALTSEKWLAGEPFVYLFGDDLLLEPKTGEFVADLIKTFNRYKPSVVVGVEEVPWEEIGRYGSIKYLTKAKVPNQVESVLEKLPASEAPSNMAQFGRFVVSPKVFQELKKQNLGKDKELWFADLVNKMAKVDLVIAQKVKKGNWLTTGDPLRWLKANIEYGLKDKNISQELRQYLKNLKI